MRGGHNRKPSKLKIIELEAQLERRDRYILSLEKKLDNRLLKDLARPEVPTEAGSYLCWDLGSEEPLDRLCCVTFDEHMDSFFVTVGDSKCYVYVGNLSPRLWLKVA